MKKLLLAGGGHSHIQLLKRLKEDAINDVEVTLISPSKYQYFPELFPGFAEGIYSEEEIRIDLEKLSIHAEVRWMEGAVLSIDPQQKLALTAGGNILHFDLISFNIGTMTKGADQIPLSDDIYTIKPNYQFANAIESIRGAEKLIVAGEESSAIEISSALQSWRMNHGIHTPVTFISSHRLLPDEREDVSQKIFGILKHRNILLRTKTEVSKINGNKIITNSEEILFDKLLLAGNTKAPDIFKLSKLPVDESGYLSIEETLQVKKYPFIFAAGECAVITGHPQMTHTSHNSSIKQGNVLFTNIKGYIETGEGELFFPERKSHLLLHIGNKKGLAVYKNRAFYGWLPWVLRQYRNKKLLE
ncbi:NAD(P)/FAD-dependent oxidoreductase [Bacillus sp. AK031]